MLCSSGAQPYVLDSHFVPELVTHAKCKSRFCRGAGPSPFGRRWREAPDEGRHAEMSTHSCPHPPLRGTLSRRERDALPPAATNLGRRGCVLRQGRKNQRIV